MKNLIANFSGVVIMVIIAVVGVFAFFLFAEWIGYFIQYLRP